MSRSTRLTLFGLLLSVSISGTLSAQASRQLKANISMRGGSLDGPATGTMYFGGAKVRLELTSNGEQITLIQDLASGSLIMLMPSEKMYMEMPEGMGPVSPPRARSMDPANPCSAGEATGCTSLGEETVNGYAARKWEYEIDGKKQTAWIATQLRFPVRIVDEDGTTVDYSNVAVGAQPASLFAPPADYQAMDMGPMAAMMGAMGGRGGRGGMPPGMDPAMMGRMGFPGAAVDPSALAGATPVSTGTPWEQGDGWIIDVTITASGSSSSSVEGGQSRSTYSAKYTMSVPLTYGTPGAGAIGVGAVGPAWQLVPTLGSARALAQPFTFTGETQQHVEGSAAGACGVGEQPSRTVIEVRGSGQQRSADHSAMPIAGIQARWELSPDLKTHHLLLAAGGPVTETTERQTTFLAACGSPQSTESDRDTRERSFGMSIDFTGLPLPASPATMSGTRNVPMRFEIGSFTGELDATVQWSLRPIGR